MLSHHSDSGCQRHDHRLTLWEDQVSLRSERTFLPLVGRTMEHSQAVEGISWLLLFPFWIYRISGLLANFQKTGHSAPLLWQVSPWASRVSMWFISGPFDGPMRRICQRMWLTITSTWVYLGPLSTFFMIQLLDGAGEGFTDFTGIHHDLPYRFWNMSASSYIILLCTTFSGRNPMPFFVLWHCGNQSGATTAPMRREFWGQSLGGILI